MAFDEADYSSGGPWGLFWPGCCCEIANCAVFSTDFSPCPSTPDADDWDEIVDGWSIVDGDPPNCSGQYLESGSAGSMLICTHPTDSEEQWVSVVHGAESGSKPRTLLGVDYDPGTGVVSSYYFVEMDIDANTMNIGVGTDDGEGGFDETVLVSFDSSIAPDTTVEAWISGVDGSDVATISAGVDGDCVHQGTWICAPQGGKYTGLMNGPGATAAARFSGDQYSYVVTNHTDTPRITEPCNHCDCRCDQSCVPKTLSYSLTLLSGDECCQGNSGTFDFDEQDQGGQCRWHAEIDIGCAYGLDMNLIKPTSERDSACDDWGLEDVGTPGWDKGPGVYPPDVCTCDPFYMRWDFGVSYPGGDSCGFRLEIYDPAS